jgi:hypothetical protein
MLFHMNSWPLIMYSKLNAAHRTRFFPKTENSVIEITYLTVLDTAKLKVINA